MWQLEKIVNGSAPSGVYRYYGQGHPAMLADELALFGWEFFYVDGRLITDKASFVREVGGALGFPAYAGSNWDAFEELIRDLNWDRAGGYVLLYEYPQSFANQAPAEWATALSILESACRFWDEEGTPFYVLLRRVAGQFQEIDAL